MKIDDEVLEDTVQIAINALKYIAQREDCLYFDSPEDERPRPCDCAPCSARCALRAVEDWRRRCSRQERLEHCPRERKIVDAFCEQVDDLRLARILDEDTLPSIRDWYVAVSAVRWLATNCGMAVLEAAGWKYDQYDEDRVEREKKYAE